MKGVGGYFKLPDHSLHCLPQLPARVLVGRGTGTATLMSKVLQHLAALREEVLHLISLDLHRCMTPWTGLGSSRSWSATVWDPKHARSSRHTVVA